MPNCRGTLILTRFENRRKVLYCDITETVIPVRLLWKRAVTKNLDLLLNGVVYLSSIIWKYDDDQSWSLFELPLTIIDSVLEMLIIIDNENIENYAQFWWAYFVNRALAVFVVVNWVTIFHSHACRPKRIRAYKESRHKRSKLENWPTSSQALKKPSTNPVYACWGKLRLLSYITTTHRTIVLAS